MGSAAAAGRIVIMVAEDDPVLGEELRHGLEAEGFAVVEARDKAAVFEVLEHQAVDLITLDLSLGDGFGLATQIRAARNVPIVMITSRSSPTDRVAGLEHGADDYITKPFHLREAVIRIRSVLARYGALPDPASAARPPDERIAFDQSVLDVRHRSVEGPSGRRIALTETEFRILMLLITHPGRVLSRDDLSLALAGRRWSPFDRTIDGHVARLRQKLGEQREERLIRSVRTVGYVFVGDSRSLAADAPAKAGSTPPALHPGAG